MRWAALAASLLLVGCSPRPVSTPEGQWTSWAPMGGATAANRTISFTFSAGGRGSITCWDVGQISLSAAGLPAAEDPTVRLVLDGTAYERPRMPARPAASGATPHVTVLLPQTDPVVSHLARASRITIAYGGRSITGPAPGRAMTTWVQKDCTHPPPEGFGARERAR